MADKPVKKRVMVSLDTRIIKAVDMFVDKMSGMMGSHINTKSQLIEEAILTYFNLVNFTLQEQNKVTKKEEKKDEN